MLHVVTLRLADEAAYGHIVADGCDKAFCGAAIPAFILIQWNDPRNPWLDRQTVTCTACESEWRNGRQYGWREASIAVEGSQNSPDGS